MSRFYFAAMVRLASRLLLLLAVLLLPLGMAPATAAPAQHGHAMASSMPMQHCPDPQKEKPGIAVCAMACAAALPAVGKPLADPTFNVCAPQQPLTAQLLRGLHPETATPPPRRA